MTPQELKKLQEELAELKAFKVRVLQYWYWKRRLAQHKHPEHKRHLDRFAGELDQELKDDLEELQEGSKNQLGLF